MNRKHNTTTEAEIRRLVGEGLNFVRNSGCGAVTASPVALGWGRLTPWTDKEIERFGKRVALFARRGLDTAQAEALADRLAARDQERDDRHVCIECAHLQRDGNCFKAKSYSAEPMAPVRGPVTDLLQRCAGFFWQTP